MAQIYMTIASLLGMLAVVLGAFGAHGLKNRLDDTMMNAWQTAVQYHFYHVFALFLVAILMFLGAKGFAIKLSAIAFILGILLFSGSLYGLALTGWKVLGPITPLGGLFFIIAWLSLAVAVIKFGV